MDFLLLREMYAQIIDRLPTLERDGATPTDAADCLILHFKAFGEGQLAQKLVDKARTLGFTFELSLRKTPANEAFLKRVTPCGEKLKNRVEALPVESVQWNERTLPTVRELWDRIVNLRTWHKMTGVEFENFIIGRLEQQGFSAQGTKASGDEGIDIVAVWQGCEAETKFRCLIANPIPGQTYLIQCKRYEATHAIGQPVLRELYGSVKGADPSAEGVLTTTSHFSEPAVAYARRMGIRLIDGETLDALLRSSAP